MSPDTTYLFKGQAFRIVSILLLQALFCSCFWQALYLFLRSSSSNVRIPFENPICMRRWNLKLLHRSPVMSLTSCQHSIAWFSHWERFWQEIAYKLKALFKIRKEQSDKGKSFPMETKMKNLAIPLLQLSHNPPQTILVFLSIRGMLDGVWK